MEKIHFVNRKEIKSFTCKVDARRLETGFKKCPDYTRKTSTRRIPFDFRGQVLYMSAPLTKGNSKLDKSVLIFDLLAVTTCPDCKDCRRDCYALKSQRQYKPTYNARLFKTHLAVHYLGYLEALIMEQLYRDRGRHPYVRIHSSGDFFSAEYAAMWARIAERFPDVVFYCYTKSPFAPVDSRIVIVPSFDSQGLPNFGSLEDVKARAARDGGYVCEYRTKKWCEQNGIEYDPEIHAPHCGKTCTYCMTRGARAFFVVH